MGDGVDVADLLNLWFIDDTPVVYPAQDNSHPAATPPDPSSPWPAQKGQAAGRAAGRRQRAARRHGTRRRSTTPAMRTSPSRTASICAGSEKSFLRITSVRSRSAPGKSASSVLSVRILGLVCGVRGWLLKPVISPNHSAPGAMPRSFGADFLLSASMPKVWNTFSVSSALIG